MPAKRKAPISKTAVSKMIRSVEKTVSDGIAKLAASVKKLAKDMTPAQKKVLLKKVRKLQKR